MTVAFKKKRRAIGILKGCILFRSIVDGNAADFFDGELLDKYSHGGILMKKFISFIVAALMSVATVFGLVACGEGNDGDTRPVLKVGMECAYQPYNWTQFDKSNGAVAIKGKTGQYANGYDVKIAKMIADELDMKLEIHAYEWESLVPAVQSGALDFIIAGMSPTAERKEKIDFSEPYYESNLVIVVRKDGAFANATSLADLSGAKITAQSATFHETVISQIAGVSAQPSMEDFPTMITALKSKTIDGYIAEQPGAIADCNGNSDFKYLPLVNNTEFGFTVADLSNVTLAVGLKKNSELLTKINTIIAGITVDQRQALMNEAITQAAALGL